MYMLQDRELITLGSFYLHGTTIPTSKYIVITKQISRISHFGNNRIFSWFLSCLNAAV